MSTLTITPYLAGIICDNKDMFMSVLKSITKLSINLLNWIESTDSLVELIKTVRGNNLVSVTCRYDANVSGWKNIISVFTAIYIPLGTVIDEKTLVNDEKTLLCPQPSSNKYLYEFVLEYLENGNDEIVESVETNVTSLEIVPENYFICRLYSQFCSPLMNWKSLRKLSLHNLNSKNHQKYITNVLLALKGCLNELELSDSQCFRCESAIEEIARSQCLVHNNVCLEKLTLNNCEYNPNMLEVILGSNISCVLPKHTETIKEICLPVGIRSLSVILDGSENFHRVLTKNRTLQKLRIKHYDDIDDQLYNAVSGEDLY